MDQAQAPAAQPPGCRMEKDNQLVLLDAERSPPLFVEQPTQHIANRDRLG